MGIPKSHHSTLTLERYILFNWYYKVRSHYEQHQTAYQIGAFVVVAAITYTIMRSNVLQRGAGISILPRGVTNTASFVFKNKQTINVITVVKRSGRGHPGWPVQNKETLRTFFTQGEAARWANSYESVMSGHLQGKIPDVNGLHFEHVSLN